MELLPDSNSKDQTEELDDYVSKLMEKLESVQDILGIIHDYDTIIAYLKRLKGAGTRSALVNSIIAQLNQERKNKYEGFVKLVKADLSARTNNFLNRMVNVMA